MFPNDAPCLHQNKAWQLRDFQRRVEMETPLNQGVEWHRALHGGNESGLGQGEDYHDPARKEDVLGRTKTRLNFVGRTSQRPDCGPGKNFGMLGKSLFRMALGFTVCRCQPLTSQWLATSLVLRFCKRCGKGPTGKASGLAWTHGTVCVCAPHPPVGMSWGSLGRMASSFSCQQRRRWRFRTKCRTGPLSLRKC